MNLLDTLKKIGFDVIAHNDLKYQEVVHEIERCKFDGFYFVNLTD